MLTNAKFLTTFAIHFELTASTLRVLMNAAANLVLKEMESIVHVSFSTYKISESIIFFTMPGKLGEIDVLPTLQYLAFIKVS